MLYLLHFEPAFHHARHYIGWCQEDRLQARLREHAQGKGAAIVRAAIAHGCGIFLARVIPEGTPLQERQLKNNGRSRQLCPFCCPVLAGMKKDAYQLDTTRPLDPPTRDPFSWPTGRSHRITARK